MENKDEILKMLLKQKSAGSSSSSAEAPGSGLGAIGSGAASGAKAGPAGMIAGGALGLLKRQAQAKRFNQKLQGDTFTKSGEIAQETGRAEQSALARLMSKLKLENKVFS